MVAARIEACRGIVSPARWQQIKTALYGALELDPQLRLPYIDRISANDPDMRRELESLLVAYDGAPPTFLEKPAPAFASLQTLTAGAWKGRRVGAYELIEQIGSGGMGEVYRAVRADDEYQKQVAIKLVRVGQDSAFVVQRFKVERQILAALDHPHIARLLDGGTTGEGLPYFVMELIDGEPIDLYCESHQLDVAARLRLFLQVCGAVQYAHQHLTVHRDLKPTNILVSAEGVPKLLDFGIAKILAAQPHARSDAESKTAFRMMTPRYASPEQRGGELITTASDVYSLGIVLYELLTGEKPANVTLKAPTSGSVATVPPHVTKPSAAVRRAQAESRSKSAPAKLEKQLRGDLDSIVLKAIDHEAVRRYDSVEQFAEDIRRHLQHLPVVARPATIAYRVGSFARRHRVGVGAAALIALAMLIAVLTTQREAHIAEQALASARAESRASDQVMGYLLALFDGASPDKTGGKPIDPRALVDQGQSQLDGHLSDQPMLRARMLAALGTLYCKLGQAQPCRRDLEQALSLQSSDPAADPMIAAQFDRQLAAAYNSAGRADEAIALLERALRVFEAEQPPNAAAMAAALFELGRAYRAKDQPSKSIVVLERARSLLRDADGTDSLDSAETLGALAIAYAESSRRSESLSLAGARVALVKSKVGEGDVRYFDALNDYAEVAMQAGRTDEAEQDWRQVVDGYVRVYGRASESSIDTELSLADAFFQRGKLRESIEWFRRAVEDYRIAGTLDRSEYMGALGGLSQVLWQYGDYRGAEVAAHESYVISQRMRGPTPIEATATAFRWAHVLAFVGATRRALELLAPEVPGDPNVLAVRRWQGRRLLWLGDSYREAGAYAQAEDSYDQAIALYRSLQQPQSVALTMAYEGKALLLGQQRNFVEAIPLWRLAISGYEANHYQPDGPAIAAAKVQLAAALAASGQPGEARSLLAAVDEIAERELGPEHPARLAAARLRRELKNPR
jgi:eukaryotic-like serine/threonine-protein kinase